MPPFKQCAYSCKNNGKIF